MSDLLIERRGRVSLITLNRPETLNTLIPEMWGDLRDAFEDVERDPEVGAVVVTGAGRGFSSGGDIQFMESVMGRGGKFVDFRPLVEAGRDVALVIRRIMKPVIAAVNGAAAGGGMSLALACDVRWASENARFG